MTWSVLHIIGIIAYAASGAFVALQVKYSLIGIFVFGLTTAYGGSVIRNVILDIPVSDIWNRETILIVLITLMIIVFVEVKWVHHWKRWGYFFDSIGLASFAIHGALVAKSLQYDLGIIVIASMFTGVGGGMIRDVLAGRTPLALKEEIHAILAILCAICIWFGWSSPIELTFIVFFVVFIRMLSIRYKFRLILPCHQRDENGIVCTTVSKLPRIRLCHKRLKE
ncbi:trimeric intracellular cation channel family protein [Pseudalkalibacillus decolorationis]|uniref:trimeric intracellular cation channel family protein n=1 Tax=Pseudalkalibacillus decolorationis TaxID=163879 RepID=UPI002147854A|nr:trimeric intracellular cation channel family protein [Pseudalkalibacillus decolorationis]